MPTIEKMKAIVYADQNNLFFRFKKIDHVKLLGHIKDQYNLIRAISYFALDSESDPQNKFVTYLSNNGWKCETVDKDVNSNIDVMLVTDMCNDRYVLDHKVVILLSGDGDYAYALNSLSKAGYFVHVYGAKDYVSLELLKVADKITYIDDIPGLEYQLKK